MSNYYHILWIPSCTSSYPAIIMQFVVLDKTAWLAGDEEVEEQLSSYEVLLKGGYWSFQSLPKRSKYLVISFRNLKSIFTIDEIVVWLL